MYELTLNASERNAIDWIGNRYSHGDELKDILTDCKMTSDECNADDIEWCGDYDITFHIPEHAMWTINDEIINGPDNLACFGNGLIDKLLQLSNQVV